MLVTVADVLLRTFFGIPVRGVLELVELGLACTIFVALPAVFLRDEHLVVDVVDHLFRPAGCACSTSSARWSRSGCWW